MTYYFYYYIFNIAAVIYLFSAFIGLHGNAKNLNNIIYFVTTLLLAYWTAVNAQLYIVSDPEIAAFLRKSTVISWGTLYSFLLYFTLRLSGLNKIMNKNYKRVIAYLFIFVPAIINIVLYIYYPYTSSELIFTNLGWSVVPEYYRGFLWEYYFYFYYLIFMGLTLTTIIVWMFKTPFRREKKYAKYLFLSLIFLLVFGSIFEIILPIRGVSIVTGITLFIALVPMMIVLYIIKKFGFLNFGYEQLGLKVMELTNEGVIICNLNGDIQKINDGALALLHYSSFEELLNISQVGLSIYPQQNTRTFEFSLITKTNNKISVLLTIKPILDTIDDLFGYLLVFQDFSELKKTKDELRELNNNLEQTIEIRTKELKLTNSNLKLEIENRKKAEDKIFAIAYKDYLTGLYNRRYYEDSLTDLDYNDNYPLTIVMADINGLKLINDAFGHMAGDSLLKEAAGLLANSCRKQDILSRIGGDEFVIIMPKTTGKEAEEIIKEINLQSKKIKVHSIDLSISFGYETKTTYKENIHEIFRVAEDLMYREKLLKIPSMRSSAIETILKTLYERDESSEIHSRAVSIISEVLAIKMGMNIQNVSEVKTAGLLHDIGKILISNDIINKEGPLTIDEYYEMKKHSEIGFRVLNSINEMRDISNIVLHHHEKWDGTGYPSGVKGEDIPLMSRIISIADSFDAMTSVRTYKQKMTKEEALQEIIDHSGTQFDPELVTIFKDNFEDISRQL